MRSPYPLPGKLWSVNGHGLHAIFHPGPPDQRGCSAPTVVFDAALGGSSLSWVYVERAIRALAPTFCYDRAGLGWSPAGSEPRDLPNAVSDLRELLRVASVPEPYLLVGHSYGALVVRQFTAAFPELVAGLVLVDPPALGEWAEPDPSHRSKLESGIRLSRRGALASRCGAAQLGAWLIQVGALRVAARLATLVSGGRLRTAQDFNFTPAMRLPPEDKPVMRWFWTRARFYDALASQMESLPAACRLIAQAAPVADLPLTVVSATDSPASQVAEHAASARQSSRGRHLCAQASGHWIPLEEPECVIAAVEDTLAAAAQVVYDRGQSVL